MLQPIFIDDKTINIFEIMACITMLVYSYGNNIESSPGEQIVTLDKAKYKLNKDSLEIFNELQLICPFGTVEYFLDQKSSDLQVGIALNKYEKRISVVFRGSQSYTDFWYDLLIYKKKLHRKVKVHNGFYKQLHHKGSYGLIVNNLLELLNEYPYDIYITGHSLGGALATLFAYELSTTYPGLKMNVITFGSPRVGNKDFMDDFEFHRNIKCYRVKNSRDYITMVPKYHYYHVGTELKLNSLSINKNRLSLFQYYKRYFLAVDHKMKQYYDNIVYSKRELINKERI